MPRTEGRCRKKYAVVKPPATKAAAIKPTARQDLEGPKEGGARLTALEPQPEQDNNAEQSRRGGEGTASGAKQI